MPDDYWVDLIFDLYDRNTEDDPNLTRAERITVDDFARVHARETKD